MSKREVEQDQQVTSESVRSTVFIVGLESIEHWLGNCHEENPQGAKIRTEWLEIIKTYMTEFIIRWVFVQCSRDLFIPDKPQAQHQIVSWCISHWVSIIKSSIKYTVIHCRSICLTKFHEKISFSHIDWHGTQCVKTVKEYRRQEEKSKKQWTCQLWTCFSRKY